MATLSDAELASLRATQEEAMPGSCEVYRATGTPDALGTWTEVETKMHTYACRMQAGSPREFKVADKLAGETLWTLTLPHDADVLHADRLVAAGHSLRVVGPATGGEWATALRLVCREVT